MTRREAAELALIEAMCVCNPQEIGMADVQEDEIDWLMRTPEAYPFPDTFPQVPIYHRILKENGLE